MNHLAWIRERRCLVCGRRPCEAAHVRYSDFEAGKANAMGKKPGDQWTVPLCPTHHRGSKGQHSRGERLWWEAHNIDPLPICQALWDASGDDLEGDKIVLTAYWNSLAHH